MNSVTLGKPRLQCKDWLDVALAALVEGGIIMSKMLDEGCVLSNQILQHRSYIRLVFGDV